ncbi:MAG TPA: transcriptional regulator [Alphaproteobacteria bacterium]|nr:transcriptional regulator [Alphaproteobacteria bacterium]
MTEEEIYQAALSDPDNPPMTAEDWARLKPVPRVRTLRRALGMTQEDFAQKFHIPLGTLRDWEQGRSVPDQPAKVLLRLIAHDPEGVMATLAKDAAAVESA